MEWKASKNAERDSTQIKQLQKIGWYVIVVWECKISSKTKRKERLSSLMDEIEYHWFAENEGSKRICQSKKSSANSFQKNT